MAGITLAHRKGCPRHLERLNMYGDVATEMSRMRSRSAQVFHAVLIGRDICSPYHLHSELSPNQSTYLQLIKEATTPPPSARMELQHHLQNNNLEYHLTLYQYRILVRCSSLSNSPDSHGEPASCRSGNHNK
jgi:hypothetical protein